MSVFWPTVTCIYLSASFITFAWALTWVIWPVAAVYMLYLRVYLKTIPGRCNYEETNLSVNYIFYYTYMHNYRRSWQCINISPFTRMTMASSGKYIENSSIYDNVSDISIDMNLGSVEIKKGSKLEVIYTGAEKFKPAVSVSGTSLNIEQHVKVHLMTNIKNSDCTLTITIPDNVSLNSIQADLKWVIWMLTIYMLLLLISLLIWVLLRLLIPPLRI